jgi:DNA-directed RNA polymerase subunit beta
LNVEVRTSNGQLVQLVDEDDDYLSRTRLLGINIQRQEHGSDEEDARRQAERNERKFQ